MGNNGEIEETQRQKYGGRERNARFNKSWKSLESTCGRERRGWRVLLGGRDGGVSGNKGKKRAKDKAEETKD